MDTKARMKQITEGLQPKIKIEAALAAKAWDDPQFKQELMEDPRTVLAREIDGFDQLPAGIEISIFEEQPDSMYFVLPTDPVPATSELSDAELEVVAGGRAAAIGGSNCCVSNSFCCETL